MREYSKPAEPAPPRVLSGARARFYLDGVQVGLAGNIAFTARSFGMAGVVQILDEIYESFVAAYQAQREEANAAISYGEIDSTDLYSLYGTGDPAPDAPYVPAAPVAPGLAQRFQAWLARRRRRA